MPSAALICFYGWRYFLHAWHSQASFPSPKGANVNNRGWNDRRSWNLRIADTLSPIVPKGGEQEQDWVLFAPFGTLPLSRCLSAGFIPFGHSTSGYWKLAPFGDRRLPEEACGEYLYPPGVQADLQSAFKKCTNHTHYFSASCDLIY